MRKIDTFKIKEMTNQLIGYDNFIMEEKMNKSKTKNIALVSLGVLAFGGGVATVNALTDNGVVNTIGKAIPIKIISSDEEAMNATCKEVGNGKYSCTYEGETLDGQVSYSLEYETDNIDDKDSSAKVYFGYVDLSDNELKETNFDDVKIKYDTSKLDDESKKLLEEYVFASKE